MKEPRKEKLENGVTLVTVPQEGADVTTVMALTRTGSKHETAENNGISHFLEHLCFKGTEKMSCKEVNETLDALGAESNAFTGNEYTGYWAKSAGKHVEKTLSVITDIYANAVVPQEDMDKERGVILEEINMYEDLPQRKVWEVLYEKMYSGQPAGRTILGPKENIKNMSRDEVIDYRNAHYVAEKTFIVVAGYVPENISQMVLDSTQDIRSGKVIQLPETDTKQSEPQTALFKKETDQVHLILGFRSSDMFDDQRYKETLLAGVLGKGMSSRLFQYLRDELGICYYTRAVADPEYGHGQFTISAGVGKERYGEALVGIKKILHDVRQEEVSGTELEKVQEQLRGNMLLGLETSDSLGQYYGFQALYEKKLTTPDEKLKNLLSVTAEDIKEIANKLFVRNNLTLATIGAVDEEEMQKFVTDF
jgi:predicted Zn-dependent peptidase